MPIRWKVAYFGSMFFLIDLLLNCYNGWALSESLLIAGVAAPASLLPWWLIYRIWGRDEAIVGWWLGTTGPLIHSQDKPLDILWKSLTIMVIGAVVFALLSDKLLRYPQKPASPLKRSLWDADVDGPK